MGYRDHLKPIIIKTNRIKSARNPSEYMPPHQAYRCEYLKNWLTIKLIWKLGMQREEAKAIKELVLQERCDTSQFTFPTAELQSQRASVQNMLSYVLQEV